MKLTYKHTAYACYMSYIVGAVINNFAPLLFVAFSRDFGITLNQLAFIIIVNFVVQMFVDFFGANYVDKIGYRSTLIAALMFACVGLVSLGTLPYIISSYAGILISVLFYAIGSGLLEVLVSPTIEALPREDDTSLPMGLLHSFYCWGCVLVISLSTIYFRIFGVENWRYLSYIWAILPLVNVIVFTKVPIIPFSHKMEKMKIGEIVKSKLFWMFALLMLCSGAAEIAMSQWASLFAETGLRVSKTTGDLLGPCFFAIMMGTSRLLQGKYGEKIDISKTLIISSIITIAGYLMASLIKNPIVALVGCGVVGFGVGALWPGVLSLAAKNYPAGGVAIFGLLAMGGDVGCWVGPYAVAEVSSHFTLMGSDLKAGVLFSCVFPALLIVTVIALSRYIKKYK